MKKERRVVLMLAAAFVGIFGYFVYMPSGPLEQVSARLIYPILVVHHAIVTPIKSYMQCRAVREDIEKEMLALRQEREVLLAQNIELQAAVDYMADIRELVEFKQRYDYTSAPLAEILTKNFSEQAHFYLVDKGSNHGIVPDMVAIYKDCIVGRVTEVYPHYSKIILVTDRACKIAATCASTKAVGIYQGTNQDWQSMLEHVSHLTVVEPDDLLVSSGEGLVFPRGFGLGRVKDIRTDGLFHHVTITPLVNVRALTHCYLVQKGSTPIQQSV